MADHPEQPDRAIADHAHEPPVPAGEGPLDPASQSLADALRLSFRVLKFVMVLLVVAFLLSGIFMVDQKEVVVLSRFGRLTGEPRQPGLNFAWPYPIDEQIRVSTSIRSLSVDRFWLNIPEKDRARNLSELEARGRGLEPGVDGALVTGDRNLMHLLLNVEYRVGNEVRLRADRTDPAEQVSDVILFVRNVQDPPRLLRAVIENAAVAEGGRATADVVWRDPTRVALAVQARAQQTLDRLETGIVLEQVSAERSYFPLQAREEFVGVSNAENQRRQAINAAETERTKKLLEVSGGAWEALNREIQRLDQQIAQADRAATIARIGQILADEAKGEAGGKIQVARKDREKILDDTLGEVARFHAYLETYRTSPDLVRRRLATRMLNDLFRNPAVVKWYLPPGSGQIQLILNRDPEEIRQAERDLLRKKAGTK